MPPGNIRTSTRMIAPNRARQYSVCRMTVSCRVAKIAAPAIGPFRDSSPPKSTKSDHEHQHDRADRADRIACLGRDRPLGEGEQTARKSSCGTRDCEGDPMDTLDVDADRLGPHWRIASCPHRVAERRKQNRPQ